MTDPLTLTPAQIAIIRDEFGGCQMLSHEQHPREDCKFCAVDILLTAFEQQAADIATLRQQLEQANRAIAWDAVEHKRLRAEVERLKAIIVNYPEDV
jgi:hypothetical protein